MNAYAKLLRDHPLFAPISSRAINRLTARAAVIDLAKGGVVVEEGDRSPFLYIVLSGRCQSTMLLADGSEQILDIYSPGDTFGERALLSADRSWTTVKVITDCTLLRIDGEDVLQVMKRNYKLEQGLEIRMHDQLRRFRQERGLGKLGRIAVIASLTEASRNPVVASNVAIAIRKETGRSVLHVQFLQGLDHPALSDFERIRAGQFDDLRAAGNATKSDGGVWRMRVFVHGAESESEYVAPVLGLLAKQARYVVLHVAPDVPGPVTTELLVQADLAYILLQQQPEDFYRGNLLKRQVVVHPTGAATELLPMVCLEYGERSQPFDVLGRQLGAEVHGYIHQLPKSAVNVESHYEESTKGRFSSHIRHLAREIGRCRIGLALSSGGAKAYAHIGVIQVLEENGIDVDVIAGASMGGFVGALWAFGMTGAEMEQLARQFEKWWNKLRLFDPAFPPRRGFIRGMRIRQLLAEAIGNAHFSDMAKQLRIVATDLDTLERIIFDSGPVASAIHASMAMPGIVVPVELKGRTYVDGGVSDPIPVDVLIEMGVEHIIAVNTIPNPQELKYAKQIEEEFAYHQQHPTGMLGILNRYLNYFAGGNILDIWSKSMHGSGTRIAEGACKQADIVLRPAASDAKWHDFDDPGRYIALGRKAAEEKLEELCTLS